jgi:hypothetical protein
MPDSTEVRARIQQALRAVTDLPPNTIADVGFHMTDWLSDLRHFHEFCEHPDRYADEEVAQLLMDFLVHVPNHVAAAGKLYAGKPVEDIFEVGAVSST